MSPKKRRIIVVEDDFLFEEYITQKITRVLGDVSIQTITTEVQFLNALPEIVVTPPDAIIMDCMLPWENPTPNPEPRPKDVEKEGVTRAGIRCLMLLKKHNISVKTMLFSALPEEELEDELSRLPGNVKFQSKNDDITDFLEEC